MRESNRYQVEERTNRAISVEAGNGPGRWFVGESQDALRRLDARLNPDHGSAGPAISGGDGDSLEHRALIAFSAAHDNAIADVAIDAEHMTWGDQPTDF